MRCVSGNLVQRSGYEGGNCFSEIFETKDVISIYFDLVIWKPLV